jgi:hypothetical protein
MPSGDAVYNVGAQRGRILALVEDYALAADVNNWGAPRWMRWFTI